MIYKINNNFNINIYCHYYCYIIITLVLTGILVLPTVFWDDQPLVMWVRKPLPHNRHTKQEGRTNSATILSSQFPGIEMPEWTKVMWKIKQLVLKLGD